MRSHHQSLPTQCFRPGDLDWGLGMQHQSRLALRGSYTAKEAQPPGLCPSRTPTPHPPTPRSQSLLGEHLSTPSTQSVGPLLQETLLTHHPKRCTSTSAGPPLRPNSLAHLFLRGPGAFTARSTHKVASPQDWELLEGGLGLAALFHPNPSSRARPGTEEELNRSLKELREPQR